MIRNCLILLHCLILGGSLSAQDTLYMELDQAIDSARNNNRLFKIFQYKIENARGKLSEMKSHYYPRLIFDGSFAYNSDPDIRLKKGGLNPVIEELIHIKWIDDVITDYFPVPPKDIVLLYGNNFFIKSNLSIYQPISQLTTVNTGRKAAETDLRISEIEKEDIESQIRVGITGLFYGILIESKNEAYARFELEYEEAEYRDALNACDAGEILPIDILALEAEIHEMEGELLQILNKKEQYLLTFAQMVGLPDIFIPVPKLDSISDPVPAPLPDYLLGASERNYSLGLANLTMQKAGFGVIAAKKEYLPELTAFAQYNYNYGIPLFPVSYFLAGLNLTWTLVAMGERKGVVNQRKALQMEASEDLHFKMRQIRNEVRTNYLNLVYARKLIITAEKALAARQEEYRLAQNAVEEGEALPTIFLKARADLAKAEADLLGAQLNYQLLIAKMKRLTGEE
ncbi:MAG: TolC family protein [Bacteroidota bacterium]